MRSIESMWRNQTGTGRARLLGLSGAVLVSANLATWALLLSFSAFGSQPTSDALKEAAIANALCALLALVCILLPWPLVSTAVLCIAFTVSFVMEFGWYMLLTPALPAVGIGDVLYFVAAIMMAVVVFVGPSHQQAD